MFTIKYKNIGLIALGALLSFSSCEKEADSDNENGVVRLESFYAVMDGDTQDDLKSYQQGCYGIHEMHNKWGEGDQAFLYCIDANLPSSLKTISGATFYYTGSSDSSTADFEKDFFGGNLSVWGDKPYVFAAHNCRWNSPSSHDSGIYTTYEISDNQNYYDKNERNMPMMAIHGPFGENRLQEGTITVPTITLKFENLASLIRFDVMQDHNDHNKDISQIVVRGSNICGEGKAYYTYKNDKFELVTEWKGGGDHIILTTPYGTERKGVLSYVMVVPPLDNVPLEITITANNGKTKTLKGNATIQRSEFKKVPINLADF